MTLRHVVRMHRLAAVGTLVFAQMLVACASGSHDGGSHPPSITSISLSRTEIVQSELQIITLDFIDKGGDVVSIRVAIRDAAGALLLEDMSDLSGMAGSSAGTLTGTLDFTEAPVGSYSLEFTLVDAKGNASPPYSVRVRILPGFGPSANYSAPEPYMYLGTTAIGDLDGDGRNDVVAIQGSNVTGKVALYRQAANTDLGMGSVLQTSIDARGVAVADVTGDGRADLVLVGSGRVVVYAQQVNGTLASPVDYVLSDYDGGPLQVVDVDCDGRLDVATVAGGRIHVLFQDSTGALGGEVAYGDPYGPTRVAAFDEVHVADMNGDGVPDLVFQSGLLELSVALQTAPRAFGPPTTYAVPTNYWGRIGSFALGDLNGDGRADVVTVEGGNGGYINVLLQQANGTLALQPHLDLGSDTPAGVEVADLDGDGFGDIAVDTGTTVYVLYQNASHGFIPAIRYALSTGSMGGQVESRALSVGDVTGDGKPDLVTTWSSEGVFVLARW